MHTNQPTKRELVNIIRSLISLTCKYSSNKELFFKKIMDIIHVDELKRLHIIDTDTMDCGDINIDKLNPEERVVYSLMDYGFTAQEINVICRHKSINSTYVKQYRIRKKLKGAASPEAVLVLLITCVFIYLLITISNSLLPDFIMHILPQ